MVDLFVLLVSKLNFFTKCNIDHRTDTVLCVFKISQVWSCIYKDRNEQ